MAPYVDLLGRICRQGVCARQVGNVDVVILVFERSALGVYRHTAVVAHVLAASRQGVEE